MAEEALEKFWANFTAKMVPQLYFESLGELCRSLDQSLYENVESVLVQEIGPWEKTYNWWHETDYHGDGIRTLMFNQAYFKHYFVKELQKLLVDEFEKFVIVCLVYEDLETTEKPFLEAFAIFNDRVINTTGKK